MTCGMPPTRVATTGLEAALPSSSATDPFRLRERKQKDLAPTWEIRNLLRLPKEPDVFAVLIELR